LSLKPISKRDQYLFDVRRLGCTCGTIEAGILGSVPAPCTIDHLYSSSLSDFQCTPGVHLNSLCLRALGPQG
jgi:hypothetical protein